jgi:hypothetical protein
MLSIAENGQRSGDCNESVLAFRSKPFAGSLGALPDFLIRFFGAGDGEKMAPLCRKGCGIEGLTDRSRLGERSGLW